MGMVLKIAAGVLIGLLAYQIIIYKNIESEYKEQITKQKDEYENLKKKSLDAQQLRNKYTMLTNAISSYYRKNKVLPKYMSDLQCVDRFLKQTKNSCATLHDSGVFYVNYENNWVSVEPYIFDEKLYNKCKSSISISYIKDSHKDCSVLDISSIPEKKSSSFDCSMTGDNVEQLICASDKLAAIEAKLLLIYKNLLEEKNTDKQRKIVDDQNNFIKLRRESCTTSVCIEEITLKKIQRLEFLGVWSKDR